MSQNESVEIIKAVLPALISTSGVVAAAWIAARKSQPVTSPEAKMENELKLRQTGPIRKFVTSSWKMPSVVFLLNTVFLLDDFIHPLPLTTTTVAMISSHMAGIFFGVVMYLLGLLRDRVSELIGLQERILGIQERHLGASKEMGNILLAQKPVHKPRKRKNPTAPPSA